MTLLTLNLHRAFFCEVLDDSKKVEYRQRTAFWERRLSGRKYTHVRFRNGYLKNAPEVIVVLKRIVQTPDDFEIHLGNIVEKRNTDALE
jgi:hypothetical protein